MGSKEEQEAGRTLKLPLLPFKTHTAHFHSPECPSILSSPIHSSASVPFSWEEQPGKPKHSTDLSSTLSHHTKCLELPPRLLIERDAKSIAKLPSPTTVLDGPYSMGRSTRFDSSSFRMMVMGSECYGSFRGEFSSPEHDELVVGNQQEVGALVLAGKRGARKEKLGCVGFWKKRALKEKGEFGGGSYVFPARVDRGSEEDGSKITKIKRTGSFSGLTVSKSRFWTTVYEGLKQVFPWKSKKLRG